MLGLIIAFFAISGVLLWMLLLALLVAVIQIRPWDASNRDHSIKVSELPYAVFAFGCYSRHLGSWLVNNVPGPMLAIDIASAFLKSQVIFAVVDLGIAEALQAGPQTASQLAKACNCRNAEWLDRLLKAAAVLGILSKRKARNSTAMSPMGHEKLNSYADGSSSSSSTLEPAVTEAAAAAAAPLDALSRADEYYANHVTACLCKGHKSSMAGMVKLYKYNYNSAASLSKSLLSHLGETSHQLQTGQPFWQHLASDATKGAVFDEAMRAFKDLGGSSVLTGYNWLQYSYIVDVAGGNGSFLASLLRALPGASGTVVDQQQQVQRGKEWWRSNHPELLPRASFIAGNIFDGTTIPSPTGAARVAYILRNILHNWPDADAVKILKSIRAAIPADDTERARLVIIELTSSEGGMPPLLEARLLADIQMLALFGSGKERDERQFASLLEAADFRLVRMVPTVGLLVVLEAEPM